MKILYNIKDGKIFYAVPDKGWFWFTHSTNTPLTEMTIDEVDSINKLICIDLVRTCNKIDDIGDSKYAIVNNQLVEKIDWQEKIYGI